MSITYVDDEIRSDILDYYPAITDKKIYYQLLTQHVKYNRTPQVQTLQDDICLNKPSMEWHVSPTVQKLLDKIDYDWNIPYYTVSPEMPTLYLEDSLFLDDSSLYSKIKVDTWNWQEKSKCFPLIKTTNAPFISLDEHWQTSVKKDDEKKAQYPRRSIQKIALFDISSVSMGQTRQRTRNYSDYGKEVVPQDHHGSNTRSAISAAVVDGTDKQANGTTFHAATCSFLPHQEIDSFIKRKQQRINLKQGRDCQS